MESAEEYKRLHPNITIEWEANDTTSYEAKIKTAITAGEEPDIFSVHQGPDAQRMVQAEKIVELTSYIKNDPDWSKWIEPALGIDDLYVDGKIYYTAESSNHLSVFYYKDMWPNGFPETFDELYKESEGLIAQDIIPVSSGWLASVIILAQDFFIVYQYQLDPTKEMIKKADKGEISWVNDTFLEAMNITKEWYDKGIFPEDVLALDYASQAFELFAQKKAAAMWFMGEWMMSNCLEAIPEDTKNGNLSSAPLPKIDGDKEFIVTGGTAATLAVAASSPYRDIAIDILKLTNSPQAQELLFDNLVTPPGPIDKETDVPIFKELVDRQANFPITWRYVETPEIADALKANLSLLILGTPAEECLANIEKVSKEVYPDAAHLE